jgi:ferredoxin--NADP+ reductase
MYVTVTEVEHYTDKLFRFRTTRPSDFRFAAGEFTMLGFDDSDLKRAYSIASGPYDEHLEFYSIKVDNGPLTSRLQNIKINDELEVGYKPTGTLTLSNLELSGDLWLLATGTGIAPFISLLKDPTTYDSFSKIHVVWSVRKQQDLLAYNSFLQELDIDYIPTVTQDNDWTGINKRITKLIMSGVVLTDATPVNDKVMLCGSMDFNNDVKSMLGAWGWHEGNKTLAGNFVQEKAFVS